MKADESLSKWASITNTCKSDRICIPQVGPVSKLAVTTISNTMEFIEPNSSIEVSNFQIPSKNFQPIVDQFTELLSVGNFTKGGTQFYNFSGADDLLTEFENSFYTLNTYPTVVLLTLYVPVFLMALIGNILVLLTVFTDKKVKRAKNFYLINLALSDLCVTLVCIPVTVSSIVCRLWFYGVFMCKFTAFFQGVVVASSIFTLTAMGIDRYVSIQYPATVSWVTTPNQALGIIGAIWIVSSIFMGPMIYIRQLDEINLPLLSSLNFCIENWPREEDRKSYGVFLLLIVYVIPGITLSVCYAHVGQTLCTNEMLRDRSDYYNRRLSRKRAAKVLVVLVVVFMLSWLPYNIFSLCVDLTARHAATAVLPFALWLGHAHSAANPIIYWALNRRFRDRVRYMLSFIKISNRFAAQPAPEFI